MSTPSFSKQAGTNLYRLSTLSEAGVNGYWAGYYDRSGSLGDTVSTTDVWRSTDGFYLFLKATPDSWSDFQSTLLKLLQSLDPMGYMRCLWLDNSSDTYFSWRAQKMDAQASGSGSAISWSVLRSFSFTNGNYQVILPGDSTLTYIEDSKGGGFQFSGKGQFNGPAGGFELTPGALSFTGGLLGSITGELSVSAEDPGTETFWSALKVGLQYAIEPEPPKEDPELKAAEDKPKYTGNVDLIYMPVFVDQPQAFKPTVAFDPLNVLIADRTNIGLYSQSGSAPGSFNTYLRTTRGYSVTLEPQTANGALPSARLVFGQSPQNLSQPGVLTYHLSPEGAFKTKVNLPATKSPEKPEDFAALASYQLMLGLSGLEYVALGGVNEDFLVFKGGCPAYMPLPTKDQEVKDALKNNATTSHLTVLPSSGTTSRIYYAQPKQAPIFSNKEQRSDGLLDFNAMPAFSLSTGTATFPVVFPSGVYAGLNSELVDLSKQIEHVSIAPYRHYQIGKTYGVQSTDIEEAPVRRMRTETDPLGVTPQGLVAELTPNHEDFDGIYIGNMPASVYPKVALTAVKSKFKQSIQSNQLFFVAANVDELMKGTSVQYKVTTEDKGILEARGVSEDTFNAVYTITSAHGVYDTEGEFKSAIQTAAGDKIGDFLSVCGILKVEMEGWTFQLSPRSWRTDAKSPTLMIAKFCNSSLEKMIADTSSWAWPEVATPVDGSIGYTQSVIQDIIDTAKERDAPEDYQLFYQNVVSDPDWNGFLFLNAPIDINEFPDELKFLIAGVNKDKFYAHHIGFSQTPFKVMKGQPVLDQTAAFGLIDYQDHEDLYREESIQLAFKTMQLKARFANATLVEFAAQVELMINYLLATPLAKKQAARGNNLIINGSFQRVGGTPTYAFSLTGQNDFLGSSSVLVDLEVLSARLITGAKKDNEDEVLTRFLLMGNLRFIDHDTFDLFSFGPTAADSSGSYLRFSNLEIDMSFDINTSEQQNFNVRENSMSFDLSNSSIRTNGLLNNFPLTISKLIASPNLTPDAEKPTGQTPEDMGFISISAPLDQTPMSPTWYGLQYVLDMGTLGALTGGQSLKISILAAWSEGVTEGDRPAYIGIKLPDTAAFGGSLPLQGVLKLGFRSFVFQTYQGTRGGETVLCYNLRMKRFAFSILVWSFPPGNFDVVLFGEPGNPTGSLGWYAAYDDGSGGKDKTNLLTKDQTGKGSISLDRIDRKHLSGRRTPPVK